MHPTIAQPWTRCLAIGALIGAITLGASSCKDDYIYDDKAPENLGSSIYGYLQSEGKYQTMIRLIDDMGYTEVLSKTGSKTLFPADDEAFGRFFNSNPYGARRYEDLTAAQKRIIMNSCMIDMAYLSDMLPNVANSSGTDQGGKGLALRRFTSASYLDTISTLDASKMPSTTYWSRFQGKKVFLAKDAPMMVHFTTEQMATTGITNSDFSQMYGCDFTAGDIYVNGTKVVEKDIICKNGYIHVLQDVALPSESMADAIALEPNASIFNSLLDKFCAPYFDAGRDAGVKEYYNGSTALRPTIPGLGANDSVFVKRYFNEQTTTTSPAGDDLSSYGMLYYDPSLASYSSSSSQQDMGAMFVPTDNAMQDYFNGSEGGYLRDSYGSWDNVPTDVVATFLKNHQKRSFVTSVPHLWANLTDETSYPIAINASNVEKVSVTSNGVVYFINKVLPPIDYKGVYAATLTADNTTIMKWALTDDWNDVGDSQAMRFYMYLRSMENMYNLLVPTDEALQNYRDPISWAIGGSAREIWSFKYAQNINSVAAEVYFCDEDGNKGELKQTITNKAIIRNRLRDIIDMHIVVGQNEGGVLSGYINDSQANFFITKGGAAIYASGKGGDVVVNGGGDMELGYEPCGISVTDAGRKCLYDSDNGRTFFIDRMLHDPAKSVYTVLSEHPEFSTFFNLCRGDDKVSTIFARDEDFEEIFSSKVTTSPASSGIGQVVNSFNNYRYTILVPTNEAIEQAFASDPKLYTWEQIVEENDMDKKKEKALYLLKFLKYHFIDNSAYVRGDSYGPLTYESAARNQYDRFHKVTFQSTGRDLNITDENGSVAKVMTETGLYNIMARDIIVNTSDPRTATQISASSHAVIHLIDKVLNYN